jgi:hypothetical protein
VAILGAVHKQSRPIEGLGTIVSREGQTHSLVIANLGHGDPDRDKASHWTRRHSDARAMSVAGLDRDAGSVTQIAEPVAQTGGLIKM